MILVVAQTSFRPDRADDAAVLLAQVAATSRTEAGCAEYRFLRDVEDGTRCSSIELWQSREHLEAHMATPHVGSLMAALPDLVTAPPVITVHEVSSSTPYA